MAENAQGKKRSGCVTLLMVLGVLWIAGQFIGGGDLKVEDGVASFTMNLFYQDYDDDKWAGLIWEAAQKENVERIVVNAKAEYEDEYGKIEEVEKRIDITSLVSPLSEVRKYTKDEFSDQFGSYIVDWVSNKMR